MVTYSKRISTSEAKAAAAESVEIGNEPIDILLEKLEHVFGSWTVVKKRLMRAAAYILKCG